MSIPLRRMPQGRLVSGHDYNKLVDKIHSMEIQSVQNIKKVVTPHGTHLIGSQSLSNASARVLYVAEVVDDTGVTAKGVYNCKLKSFDSAEWNTLDDGFTDINNPTITGVGDISYNDNDPNDDTIVYAGTGDGFLTKGFVVGMQTTTSGTSNNNGTDLITAVTETKLTVSTSLTTEADQSATVLGKWQVMNGKETGTTTTNELVAGDRIKCWYFTDSVGNRRLIGESMEGDLRLAETTEAAPGDLTILAQLTNRAGTAVGSPFTSLLMATDGATAATSALPRIANTKKILIWKAPSGVWYVVNPTIIKSSVCA